MAQGRKALPTLRPCVNAVQSIHRRSHEAVARLEKLSNFTGLHVAARCFLAVNQVVTHTDFESPAARGPQRDGLNVGRVLREKFLRQTDGSRGVVSHYAVFNAQRILGHAASLMLWRSPPPLLVRPLPPDRSSARGVRRGAARPAQGGCPCAEGWIALNWKARNRSAGRLGYNARI